jgi:hypothetical protein
VANFSKTGNLLVKSLGRVLVGPPGPVSAGLGPASEVGLSPTDDDAIEELELDDPTIDEAALPHLDIDDPEALGQEPGYEDLLDRALLERAADDDLEDDGAGLEDIGLTIDLDGPAADEDGARIVDLDVGSLLTALPAEASELELDLLGHERGDAAMGVGVLRGMLLPESDEDGLDDGVVGDDERFPAFDDAADIVPRPGLDEDISPDELS